MIKLVSKADNLYSIQLLALAELSKVMCCPKYAEFTEIMNTINDYKNSFMSADI